MDKCIATSIIQIESLITRRKLSGNWRQNCLLYVGNKDENNLVESRGNYAMNFTGHSLKVERFLVNARCVGSLYNLFLSSNILKKLNPFR